MFASSKAVDRQRASPESAAWASLGDLLEMQILDLLQFLSPVPS